VAGVAEAHASGDAGRPFRLLSYNIQVGISTSRYRDYLTGGWKHLFPHRRRLQTLASIADQMRGYDLVGVQETDAGSRRTDYISQTEYLARRGGYTWWGERTNRRLGRFAQHSIGALAQRCPDRVEPLRLPGPLPGRGALQLDFGAAAGLRVIIVHLALGRVARRRQLDYLAERLQGVRHAIVMGDFNTPHGAAEMRRFFARTGLDEPLDRLDTWPAWRPRRNYDHILTSPSLPIARMHALADSPSDHLPIAVDVARPAGCTLSAPSAAHDTG